MNQKPALKHRWQYFFDNLMARGAWAMIVMLAFLSLIIILLAAIIVFLGGRSFAPGGTDGIAFSEAIWGSLLRTLDPGTMGADEGWGFRLVMLVLPTLGGILIISSLIGVLSNLIQDKIQELRKGRSLVLEENHTVILGWAPQIFTILAELIEANLNQRKPAIAILANKDKVEMEDEIRIRIPDTKNMRIICRSGSPIDPTDLEIISPHEARSIIVIPAEGVDPDMFVIKTVLAITNNPKRRSRPYNIITQISDAANMDVINMLGKNDSLFAILTEDVIARVTAQTSRQSGLSLVYTELLNFSGDEIYYLEEPGLVGRTYAEALGAYVDSSVIGIFQANGTEAKLNPSMDTDIMPGDRLICLSEDDSTILLSNNFPATYQPELIHLNTSTVPARMEKILLLGWNDCGGIILRELDKYVVKNSIITVVADNVFKQQVTACCDLRNLIINFVARDTTSRVILDELNIVDFDHVIVLADTSLDVQKADARTLITLLHLRDISLHDETPFSIVSEMLDLRNRELASVTGVDDFIVSTHLISLMIAQLSENSQLLPFFDDMLNEEGAEINLKPVEQYVKLGSPVNFYTVIEAARRRGETAFGYRITSEHNDEARCFGVHINPNKQDEILFNADDKIIVFAG